MIQAEPTSVGAARNGPRLLLLLLAVGALFVLGLCARPAAPDRLLGMSFMENAVGHTISVSKDFMKEHELSGCK